jgi:autotransporter family porin
MSRDDTAFNADFVYGWLRNCYEGWADYLYQRTPAPGYPSYHAGDIWGCLGFWFSGSWYDQGAINYINLTKAHYAQKPWLQPGF